MEKGEAQVSPFLWRILQHIDVRNAIFQVVLPHRHKAMLPIEIFQMRLSGEKHVTAWPVLLTTADRLLHQTIAQTRTANPI